MHVESSRNYMTQANKFRHQQCTFKKYILFFINDIIKRILNTHHQNLMPAFACEPSHHSNLHLGDLFHWVSWLSSPTAAATSVHASEFYAPKSECLNPFPHCIRFSLGQKTSHYGLICLRIIHQLIHRLCGNL